MKSTIQPSSKWILIAIWLQLGPQLGGPKGVHEPALGNPIGYIHKNASWHHLGAQEPPGHTQLRFVIDFGQFFLQNLVVSGRIHWPNQLTNQPTKPNRQRKSNQTKPNRTNQPKNTPTNKPTKPSTTGPLQPMAKAQWRNCRRHLDIYRSKSFDFPTPMVDFPATIALGKKWSAKK